MKKLVRILIKRILRWVREKDWLWEELEMMRVRR